MEVLIQTPAEEGVNVPFPVVKHGPSARIKRAIDIVAASVGLLLLFPFALIVACLIKLDSRGPVFFYQTRLGVRGRCFRMLKFRSMYQDAEDRLEMLLEVDPAKRIEYTTFHKLTDDPRVTRVGRVIRKYSIDELPQLINVLRGDMSIVGPRPYLPREIQSMQGNYRTILQVRPGITGLWQTSGRNELSFKERLDLDVDYVHAWCWSGDLVLLWRTLPVVLKGKGAS